MTLAEFECCSEAFRKANGGAKPDLPTDDEDMEARMIAIREGAHRPTVH